MRALITFGEFAEVFVKQFLSSQFGEVVVSEGVPGRLVQGTKTRSSCGAKTRSSRCAKTRGRRGGKTLSRSGEKMWDGSGGSTLLTRFIHTLLGRLWRVGWSGAG